MKILILLILAEYLQFVNFVNSDNLLNQTEIVEFISLHKDREWNRIKFKFYSYQTKKKEIKIETNLKKGREFI